MVCSPHNVKEMYVPSIDRAKYNLVYARPSITTQQQRVGGRSMQPVTSRRPPIVSKPSLCLPVTIVAATKLHEHLHVARCPPLVLETLQGEPRSVVMGKSCQ